jgi:hypothetical protein
MPISNLKQLPGLFLLGWFFVMGGGRAVAQAPIEPDGQCVQVPVLYQLANYTVKNITIKPLLRFIPAGSNLSDALAAAISIQPASGLRVNQRFDTVEVSRLEADLNEELRRRTLSANTGLIFGRHRLINCDEQARTLDVEYQVLTVARPSYLTTTFETNDRRDKNQEAAGNVEEDRARFSLAPFAGYNRSRAMFGGADLLYESDLTAIRRMALSASGSGSSAVVEMDFTGSKEFSSGPLSYAEWKGAYRFSNIPTDGFELKEATVAARLFAATRPIGSHNLYFRVGTSVEGGNRQSSLPQTEAAPLTLVDSGYGALKLYVGASFTTRKHDWKASYGLQLGNDGDNLGVDYRKQIVDVAYRLRFLPKEHKPFQLDAQFTAGSLHITNGFVPYGERFFGGNAEQEFIQGDSWRIRSNPVIRSFPQNRLNGSDPFPVGGDKFVSLNFTVAQTVWQKQLIPDEIAKDPDVIAGLGGQLLSTRVFLREQTIQQESTEMKQLEAQAGCVEEASFRNCLTPIVNRLKTVLSSLLTEAGANDDVKQAISAFTDNDGDDAIGSLENAINSAKLDPAAFDKPLEDEEALRKLQTNPVETNVFQIINDDFGDPDDPDDDMLSFITGVQRRITSLNAQLAAPNFAARKSELQVINADLEKARTVLRTGLNSVNLLRSYPPSEIQQAMDVVTQPSASNRNLEEIAVHIKAVLQPERDKARSELAQFQKRLSELNDTDPEVAAIRQKREPLLQYLDLLDASDTWAEKVRLAYKSVNTSFETKDSYGVKIDLERMSVGFGGLVSYLSGLEESVRDLRQPLNERGLTSLLALLDTDVREATIIQQRVKSAYGRLRPPKAEAKANETVSYVGRVMGVFFREANLVAVSPVLMFDAARLRVSDDPNTNRFRYGVGGGIRFSLINVDFTAGYSVNPNRRSNEPRGALVLRMDINDLFK